MASKTSTEITAAARYAALRSTQLLVLALLDDALYRHRHDEPVLRDVLLDLRLALTRGRR